MFYTYYRPYNMISSSRTFAEDGEKKGAETILFVEKTPTLPFRAE